MHLAKRLKNNPLSIVVVNGTDIYESDKRGIAPIMQLFSENPTFLSNASVADKIVGKAAAMLFIRGGIKELCALTISEPALECLQARGISVIYDKKVKNIINRSGTDICPMEKAVMNISDPEQAYTTLAGVIKAMRASNA